MGAPKQVILAHSGRQHSYYIARNLQLLGSLQAFYTSSYVASPTLQRFLLSRYRGFFSKRFLEGLSGPRIHTMWSLELPEFIARLQKKEAAKVSDLVCARDDRFDNMLSRKLKDFNFDIYWGYQGSSLKSLRSANQLGKVSLIEMTTPYLPFIKSLLTEEALLNPEWSDSIDTVSYTAGYEQRLIEEPLEASKVISVSSFLKQTLTDNGVPPEKIQVVPLGFDPSKIIFNESYERKPGRPLKLLFTGRITQVKGVKYMLDAIEQFDRKDVELHLVGNIIGSGIALMRRKNLFVHHGSMAQIKLFEFYQNFDAFLFPSLIEGFPLSVIEAMGAGLPVITTPNTSAEELIVSGKTGYLVPIRDSAAIVNAIQQLLNLNTDEFQQLRLNARSKALEYTWDANKGRIECLLADL